MQKQPGKPRLAGKAASSVWPVPLDSPFEPSPVFVPSEIHLRPGKLAWAMDRPAYKTPRGSILDQFKRLHKQPEGAVYDFAKSFGVAWFCQHHLPGSHGQVLFGKQFGMEPCGPVGCDELPWCLEEDIWDYRRFSRAADSIVTAAGKVNVGQIPGDNILRNFVFEDQPLTIDVVAFPQFALSESARTRKVNKDGVGRTEAGTVLLAGGPEPVRSAKEKRFLLESARLVIAREVVQWLQVSQARPHLGWDYRRKSWSQTLRHSPLGVLGAVALALFTTVPQSGGWLICSICSESYQPERPPIAGRNHYCEECRGSHGMWRLLKQQQRARMENRTRASNS
jgi:hypothetical protein